MTLRLPLRLLALFLFAANAYAQNVPTTYLDENKKPLTAAQFEQRVKDGAHGNVMKRMKDGVVLEVTMQISPKNAPPAPKLKYKIKPGESFPAFSLEQLAGGKIDNAALMGRYTLVNFYFAACAPCVEEVPELNELKSDRPDMNFVGMSFDSQEEAARFVVEHHFVWKLLPMASATLDTLGIKTYPTFALLDPKGKLVAIAQTADIIKSDKSVTAWVKRLVKPA
ncbi:MAG: TlpA family protein disulfide reductase [Massilia sp.]